MRFIPILFAPPMVKSIQELLKTQTRRILTGSLHVDPSGNLIYDSVNYGQNLDGTPNFKNLIECVSPYGQPGDILWVREEHYKYGKWIYDGLTKKTRKAKSKFVALDDDVLFNDTKDVSYNDVKFVLEVMPNSHRLPSWYKRLGRYMLKRDARIFLEVVEVRIERLKDISESDAMAEGIQFMDESPVGKCYRDYLSDASGYGHPDFDFPIVSSPVTSYGTLWASVNGRQSWVDNPWVWVVTFRQVSKPAAFSISSAEVTSTS